MPLGSDLVRDSKLRTTFHKGYTRHIIEAAGRSARERKLRQEQRWKCTKRLGDVTYGTVWLEELTGGTADVGLRAVKQIKKRIGRSQTIDYSQELEAIAKFSHPKVRTVLQNYS